MNSSGCVYCSGLLRRAVTERQPWDTVLAETSGFVVVPTKGALVPGWLLVVSKQHRLCAGEQTPTEQAEALAGVSLARELVERAYGPATVFEHGPASAGTAVGCGIDHLHFHVVPLPFSLEKASTDLRPSLMWRDAHSPAVTAELYRERRSYLLLQEPIGGWRVAHAPQVRQFFRQAIAARLGSADMFDYREHPHAANAIDTVTRITSPALIGAVGL